MSPCDLFVTPAEIERELLTRLQKVVFEKILDSDLETGVNDVNGLALDFVLSMEEEFRRGAEHHSHSYFFPSHGSTR